MKVPSTTAIGTVILLYVFSATGQQQSEKKPSAPPPGYYEVPAQQQKGKASTAPVPPNEKVRVRMPDGRVVEFPVSTSEEEIDALAKRIAEGAADPAECKGNRMGASRGRGFTAPGLRP